jgi:TPR repeat protein
MFNYGIGLTNGYLGIADPKQAMVWYKNATEQRHLQSMLNYGIEFGNGYSELPIKSSNYFI